MTRRARSLRREVPRPPRLTLQTVFGRDDYGSQAQQRVVELLLENKLVCARLDVGETLVYALPALVLGLCIVVSPLLSFAKVRQPLRPS